MPPPPADDPPLSPAAVSLHEELRKEGLALDPDDPGTAERLQAEVERIARVMDRGDGQPPMLWTGIPWPTAEPALDHDECLVVSVGGTRTVFLPLRLERGEVVGFDPAGREVRGRELAALKDRCTLRTPTHSDTPSGHEMVRKIARGIGQVFGAQRDLLARTRHVLLSWGFAQRAVRTGEGVLGGLTSLCTLMTKEQSRFTKDLADRDIGALFREACAQELGWSRPVTVANDTVMALHCFLTAEHRRRYHQIGLFINGTGSNFSLAEPYGVRASGAVSAPGETYEPARLTPLRPLGPGEHSERYFVNYEVGSIDLVGTRTRFDVFPDYPIESNALAGGNAFQQQFRSLVSDFLGEDLHGRLAASWRAREGRDGEPGGPEVSRIAARGVAGVRQVVGAAGLNREDEERIWVIASTIVARSAFHAALVLAAVTRRTGFGEGAAGGKKDLLAMEGSVWNSSGYPERVVGYWQSLVRPRILRVELDHEPSFDASLPGPLYLAVLHGEGPAG